MGLYGHHIFQSTATFIGGSIICIKHYFIMLLLLIIISIDYYKSEMLHAQILDPSLVTFLVSLVGWAVPTPLVMVSSLPTRVPLYIFHNNALFHFYFDSVYLHWRSRSRVWETCHYWRTIYWKLQCYCPTHSSHWLQVS